MSESKPVAGQWYSYHGQRVLCVSENDIAEECVLQYRMGDYER
jgi:hypothetical protein